MGKRVSAFFILFLVGVIGYGAYQWWPVGRQLSANQPEEQTDRTAPTYNIVTLLPLDAIPAIDHPTFVTGDEADKQYQPDELVLGIEINGDARAYSIPYLSGHEIVNDTVGGELIAVTW